MKMVPDTSAVIDGRVSERVDDGTYEGADMLVPEAVVSKLESQTNDGRGTGWEGLSELQRLAESADDDVIDLNYVGRRPSSGEAKGAGEGDTDTLARDIATERLATLLTSDVVQAEVAKAKGVSVEYVEVAIHDSGGLIIGRFFDDRAMPVHLKTDIRPKAKRGAVGEMHYQPIVGESTDEATIKEQTDDIVNFARAATDGFVELSEPGTDIVQFRDYCIAVARLPFADGIEVTTIRPIVKIELDDCEFADGLRDRLAERQRGVLIAGPPGAGKSTFAQAAAEFLNDNDYVIKTMEKPHDLQVGPDITQYTAFGGDMAKTADSLLLVHPDYTIYDEIRKTEDLSVFSDIRLAGVGMVGVIHATRAIDALQRLVGRAELGMIPQVVDTVVYIEDGEIHTVYNMRTEVKVPEGLFAEDLARPVIQIRDFESGTPEHEIYTFNRQVVTVPLGEGGEEKEGDVSRLTKQEIERKICSIARGHVDVDLQGQNRAVVYVEEDDISYVIGKGGGRTSDMEDRLGIDTDVRTHDEKPSSSGQHAGANAGGQSGALVSADGADEGVVVTPGVTSRHVAVRIDGHVDETVEARADGGYLFTVTVDRGGDIQVFRGSAIVEELENAIDRKQQITVVSA